MGPIGCPFPLKIKGNAFDAKHIKAFRGWNQLILGGLFLEMILLRNHTQPLDNKKSAALAPPSVLGRR